MPTQKELDETLQAAKVLAFIALAVGLVVGMILMFVIEAVFF